MAQKRQQVLSGPALKRAALYDRMPPWFDRNNNYTTSKDTIHINFSSPCSCGKSQQPIYVGKAVGTALADKLAKAVVRVHGPCHQTASDPTKSVDTAPIQQAQTQIADLEKQLARQQRLAADFEAQNALLLKQIEGMRGAQQQVRQAKRLKTDADHKTIPIDSANQTEFGTNVRSQKMCAVGDRPTGIIQTLEFHCEGSQAKLCLYGCCWPWQWDGWWCSEQRLSSGGLH